MYKAHKKTVTTRYVPWCELIVQNLVNMQKCGIIDYT